MNWAFSLLLLRCLVAAGLLEQMGPGRRERKAGTQACHEILMDYAWDILTCCGGVNPVPWRSAVAHSTPDPNFCRKQKVWMPTPTIWSTEFQKKLLFRRCACNAWPQEMLSAPRRCLDAPHRWPQNFYVRQNFYVQLLGRALRVQRHIPTGFIHHTHTESDGVCPT